MDEGARARQFDVGAWRDACSTCSLQDLCIPLGLDAAGLAELEQLVQTLGPLHRGDYLFRRGDVFRAIYAVRSGYLKAYTSNAEGEQQVLGFYMAGELMGLDSIGAGRKRCSAVVLDTAMVCRLPFAELSAICRRMPRLQEQLLRLMSRELVTAESLSSHSPAETRMAAFLLGWGERLARRGFSPRHFVLPMSRQEIGSYLRLAPETVSRCLGHFVKQGWIEASRRQVRFTDEKALKALCPADWRV